MQEEVMHQLIVLLVILVNNAIIEDLDNQQFHVLKATIAQLLNNNYLANLDIIVLKDQQLK